MNWSEYNNGSIKQAVRNFVYERALCWVAIKHPMAASYSSCDKFKDEYLRHISQHFTVVKEGDRAVIFQNAETNYAVNSIIIVLKESLLVASCPMSDIETCLANLEAKAAANAATKNELNNKLAGINC